MKLWKILLATMIALVLVCAVAMAETCDHNYVVTGNVDYAYEQGSDTEHKKTWTQIEQCTKCEDIKKTEKYVWGGHEMVQTGKAAATCTEGGKVFLECSICGKTRTDGDGTSKKGHSPVTTYTKGDCVNKAKDVTACQWCGEVFSTVEYAKGDHSYEVKGTVAPTCKADGYNVYVCKVCGDEKHWDATPAGHKWVAGEKVAPTCTEKGYTIYTCSACGETAKFDYKDAAHKPVVNEYVAATCNKPGHQKYISCSACSDLWTAAGAPIKSIPTIAPDSAMHEYNERNWHTTKAPTCTLNGEEANECIHCGNKITRVIETVGHVYGKASDLAKKEGTVAGIGYVTKASTCTKEGTGYLQCKTCNKMTIAVTIPAVGHDWSSWTYSNPATCTTAMTAKCICNTYGCGAKDEKVIAPATGHAWMVISGTDATCTEDGKITRYCPACETKQTDEKVPAKGHSYKWSTVVAPSAAGNGKDEYKCTVCGDVKETKTVKYTKWYYNNTITSFGPTTRELVGGNDWYRVTPVDLAVDGVYTYDLIASNKYIVGKVTITVNAGALTVSYKTNYSVDVKDEALLIYASKADLATGTAVTAPVGAAINAAETFGADTKVLVSLILTGDYDAAGKGLVDASAAAGMIANID